MIKRLKLIGWVILFFIFLLLWVALIIIFPIPLLVWLFTGRNLPADLMEWAEGWLPPEVTYVKEGNEFNKEDIKGYAQTGLPNDGFFRIKGPCGNFH